MECEVLRLTCAPSAPPQLLHRPQLSQFHSPPRLTYPTRVVLRRCSKKQESLPEGLPATFYDDEWQAKQRERRKEFEKRKREEVEEEERKLAETRAIGGRLKGYPDQDVKKARKLVASFIQSAEEVEEKIEEAAERGELTELVLLVIWNRLEIARRDEEKDAIRSLDLLYRRAETEILKREASPAMRLLNDLLNKHDGFNDDVWLKDCRKLMMDTFPREDPFSILVPPGFDINSHQRQLRQQLEAEDALLRVDFVREVDALLQEVKAEQSGATSHELDPESVANKLKQETKQRTIRQVEALLNLAATLSW